MPTLDDIDITTRQMGDQSRGVQIPGADVAGGWRSADIALGSSRGKGKIAPSGSASKAGSWSPSSNTEAATEEIAPPESRTRLIRGDGSVVGGPPLLGQQAPKKATAPQPDLKVAVMTVSSRSGGGRSATTVKEAAAAAVVAVK
jgi:Mrp family chromosome partitioning ATPase